MGTKTSVALFLTAIITFAAGSAFGAYSGGTGEPNNPYQIATKADLLALAGNTADYGQCFILTADVTMEGQSFTKAIIAADTSSSNGFQGTAFTGTFDGNGHKITDFTISGVKNGYIGLFGQIDSGCSVRNLGLENFAVNGSYYVGGLVGNDANGSITNCYSTGQTSGYSESQYVGGLAGYNGGSISNCYSTVQNGCPICGYTYVGGLAGVNEGTISDCNSTAVVSGPGGSGDLGGLVGANTGTISNCYSTGMVSGGSQIGGFAGANTGNIINCHSTGQTNGSYLLIGGFVGKNIYGSISNCFSTGSVSGSSISQFVGGLVGDNDSSGSISNCYSTGSVNVSSIGVYVGGLVGGNYNSSISNCYSMGSVSGNNYVGGLVGRTWNGSSISNCFSTGQTSGSTNVGGLAGDNGGSISSSFWDTETSNQPTSDGGTGLSTLQMKQQASFTGWDFTNETDNGSNDYWRMCVDEVNYPQLNWEYAQHGDFACPDGVNMEDLSYFVERWLLNNCNSANNYCGGKDINASGAVDMEDYALFASHWLEGVAQ